MATKSKHNSHTSQPLFLDNSVTLQGTGYMKIGRIRVIVLHIFNMQTESLNI